jgi:hypothetical protein
MTANPERTSQLHGSWYRFDLRGRVVPAAISSIVLPGGNAP